MDRERGAPRNPAATTAFLELRLRDVCTWCAGLSGDGDRLMNGLGVWFCAWIEQWLKCVMGIEVSWKNVYLWF